MGRSFPAAVLFLAVILAASFALAKSPNLKGEMEAHKIILDEKNREIAVPAEKVYPSDTIEYTLKYRNTGDASATGVNLIGPVPAGTAYLDGTATKIESLHTLFSIDGGGSYQEAPVKYTVVKEDGSEEIKIATPEMITHIRWMLEGTFAVGDEVAVSYRVQVE